jgi:heat-inducible transcriptional repressor
MRVDYKKIIPYIEYLTGKISDRMSADDENTFTGMDADASHNS